MNKYNSAHQVLISIHRNLLELLVLAKANEYHMLAYFIEMAYIESTDMLRLETGVKTDPGKLPPNGASV